MGDEEQAEMYMFWTKQVLFSAKEARGWIPDNKETQPKRISHLKHLLIVSRLLRVDVQSRGGDATKSSSVTRTTLTPHLK